MDVPTLARAVVERVSAQQARMHNSLLWEVTDVLLRYERCCQLVLESLRYADAHLLALGVRRDEDSRQRIRRAIEAIERL